MRPKKDQIDKAWEDGTITKVTVLMSAAYLLMSEANTLIEESEELMEKHGMIMGEMKRTFNRFQKSADDYFKDFASMVPQENVHDYFSDMDRFDTDFRKWASITEEDMQRAIAYQQAEIAKKMKGE